MNSLETTLSEVRQRTDKQLERFVTGSQRDFQRSYRHVLNAPAKRIRPALVYVTADTFTIARERVDSFALAIELIHTASLIFDDLPGQDNADLRRGQPTLHSIYNEGEAQMAALSMFFDAESLLSDSDTANKLNGKLTHYVNEALGQCGLCLGQLQDLQTFNRVQPVPYNMDLLDEIAQLKTGKLLEASIVGGALIASQPPAIIEILRTYAQHLGLAFQVKDDLLDHTGNTQATGKTTHLDTINDKPNYVSVLGLEATRSKLANHATQAKKVVSQLPTNLNTDIYNGLVDYVTTRKF